MGGTPRRGLLFEGAPGTGKTLPRQGDGRRGRRAVPVRVGDRRSSPCTTARPPARSARTSRRCARPPAPRAARSASSRRSTRSPWPAAASPRTPMPDVRLARPVSSAAAASTGLPSRVRRRRQRGGAVLARPRSPHAIDQRGRRRRRQRAARPDAVLRRADRQAEARPWVVDQLNLFLPAAPSAASSPMPAADQRAAHRRDQPRRQPRPGAAAPRPLRPPAHLRVPGQGRAPRAHRLLPGEQGAPPGARRRRAARRARRGDPGLHAGDDRAPLRRGAGQRPAPRRRSR